MSEYDEFSKYINIIKTCQNDYCINYDHLVKN